MLDHDADSYHKISRAFVDWEPVGDLTRDHIVDNITLYWLTGTGASAARWYWDSDGPRPLRPARLGRPTPAASGSSRVEAHLEAQRRPQNRPWPRQTRLAPAAGPPRRGVVAGQRALCARPGLRGYDTSLLGGTVVRFSMRTQ
jgi:hypothetical protein